MQKRRTTSYSLDSQKCTSLDREVNTTLDVAKGTKL